MKNKDKIDFIEKIFVSFCVLLTFNSLLIAYANIKHKENQKHDTEDLINLEIQQEKLNYYNYFAIK